MSLLLDETFEENMEKRIVYDAKSFMDACKEIEEKKIHGAAIIWDEAGVGLSSRDWYDISNKSINYAIQVLGYLHPYIFFVTQDASFLDAQPRKLLTNFLKFQEKITNILQLKYLISKSIDVQEKYIISFKNFN